MNNNIRVIESKALGNIRYRLVQWGKEEIFCIEREDRTKMLQGITAIPEIAKFDNKEAARVYFDGIK